MRYHNDPPPPLPGSEDEQSQIGIHDIIESPQHLQEVLLTSYTMETSQLDELQIPHHVPITIVSE